MEKIKIASLFTGCGGMDLGIQGGFRYLGKFYSKNPIQHVFANDIEQGACDIFQDNFNSTITKMDMKDVSTKDIPDHDILIAGFPCQSFSIVAQNPMRLGIKSNNGILYKEMIRVLKDKKPLCFIAENVKGILSANKRKAFPLILNEFKSAGYTVEWKLINSANFGIPQRRERVFIVGFKNHLNKKPIIAVPNLKSIPLKKVLLDRKSINKRYYFSQKAIDGLKRSWKNHPDMNKGRFQNREIPSATMSAHLCKASLNSMDPVLKEGRKFRRFTPREVARIQSFPDEFKLNTSDKRQYVALGNAVPPIVMWHISKSILQQIRDIQNKTNKNSNS